MSKAGLRTLFQPRSAAVVAAAVAMLLPLPLRCAWCATAASECPACTADLPAHADGESCSRSCCDATDPAAADEVGHQSVHGGTDPCGCHAYPLERNVPVRDQLVAAGAILTSLGSNSTLEVPASGLFTAARTLADLPPPIPHRILHCCWII